MMVIFMISLQMPPLPMMLVLLIVVVALMALVTLVPVTMAGTIGTARCKVASGKNAEAVCSGVAGIRFHSTDVVGGPPSLLLRRLREERSGPRRVDEKQSKKKCYKVSFCHVFASTELHRHTY